MARACLDCGVEFGPGVAAQQRRCKVCVRLWNTERKRKEKARARERVPPGGTMRPRMTDLRLVHCPDVSWPEGLEFDRGVLDQLLVQFPEGARFEDRRGRRFEVFRKALVRIGGRDVQRV